MSSSSPPVFPMMWADAVSGVTALLAQERMVDVVPRSDIAVCLARNCRSTRIPQSSYGKRVDPTASYRARQTSTVCRVVPPAGRSRWTLGRPLGSTRSTALCHRNATVASGRYLIRCFRPTPKERH
jgi:hypothetical protein